MGRILAIDYGETRVGVAVTDPMQIISSPHSVIVKKNLDELCDHIHDLVADLSVDVVLVGKPVSMSGKPSQQTHRVVKFIDELRSRLEVPVKAVDERLSSVEAKRRLHIQNIKTGHDKGKVDSMSAVLLLETYLMSR